MAFPIFHCSNPDPKQVWEGAVLSLIPNKQKSSRFLFKMENGKWEIENEKSKEKDLFKTTPTTKANQAVIAKKQMTSTLSGGLSLIICLQNKRDQWHKGPVFIKQ
jgi:hypothetical protein